MDKVLLVTGGSRGIGAATARLAARQGWAVAVNYRGNSLAADEVVRDIRAAGGSAITVQADVADEAQVLRMFEKVDAKLGRLTGLVNNAGVVDVTAREEAGRVVFTVNLYDRRGADRPGVALVMGEWEPPDCCVPVSRGARSPASSGLAGVDAGVRVSSTRST